MPSRVEDILFDAEAIRKRIGEVASEIAADLETDGIGEAERALTLVPVLTGSLVFVADLIRRLPYPMRLRMVAASAYPGAATEGREPVLGSGFGELPRDLGDRHVLIVDDILDSGRTLAAVTREIGRRRPATLRSCVLLKKQGRQQVEVEADYVGFEVPDRFVVGYGLDHDGLYRNLPHIATLRIDPGEAGP